MAREIRLGFVASFSLLLVVCLIFILFCTLFCHQPQPLETD